MKYTYGFSSSKWVETDLLSGDISNDNTNDFELNNEDSEHSTQALHSAEPIPNQSNQHETLTYEYVPVVNDYATNDNIPVKPSSHIHRAPKRKSSTITNDEGGNNTQNSRSATWKSDFLFNRKYFTMVPGTSNVAKCMSCEKDIKGYGKCTSNFISHLKHVCIILLNDCMSEFYLLQTNLLFHSIDLFYHFSALQNYIKNMYLKRQRFHTKEMRMYGINEPE